MHLRSLLVVSMVAAAVGCGGGERGASPKSASPLAPTAANTGVMAKPAASVTSLPAEGIVGSRAVAFPPRNEPLDFRTRLEFKYRDSLQRAPIDSYVDLEGSIVWTQEYLRYRLNGCAHADAVQRVFSQIDGGAIQGGCGAETTVFPPRNEPFAFRVQLEAKYRDGLRRPATPTYVDPEGDIVWTQEYLRYRVSGCFHEEALAKVFDQVDGRGVARACAPPVQVINSSISGAVDVFSLTMFSVTAQRAATHEFVLTWGDPSVDLDLVLTDPACTPTSTDCRAFAGSVSPTGTLERFSFFMRQGEAFRLFVINYAHVPQSFQIDVRLFATTSDVAAAEPRIEHLVEAPLPPQARTRRLFD